MSKKTLLIMEFHQRKNAICLPCDLELETPKSDFTFLGKKYSVEIDIKADCIRYSSIALGVLFSHSLADETFFGPPRISIQGYQACLARFISHLEDADKYTLFTNPTFLRELFNDLFAFRIQMSFAEELQFRPYSAPNFPKTRLEALCNKAVVCLPDLESYRERLRALYDAASPLLSFSYNTLASLTSLVSFFRSQLKDGTNDFADAFGYYGATSSQLHLHFAPELIPHWNRETITCIIQTQKAYDTFKTPYFRIYYEEHLLIKSCNGTDITLYSLIERGLEDLDPIHLRLPPNRRFDVGSLQAEKDYLVQLEELYTRGSPLLAAIAQDANTLFKIFDQRAHRKNTVAAALERLSHPLTKTKELFENVHGYSEDCFLDEFERGMENFLSRFEVKLKHGVECHIVDFVERLVTGSSLVEPCFKHDLLDLKHFTAGMFSQKYYHFVDGKITFAEIVFRALYEIERREIAINGQLLIDTVYLFLKALPPRELFIDICPSPTIEQLSLLENAPKDVAFYVASSIKPHWQKSWTLRLIDLFSSLTQDERALLHSRLGACFVERGDIPIVFILETLLTLPSEKRWAILDALQKIHIIDYQIDALSSLILLLGECSAYEYAYVVMSLNILRFHLKQPLIQSSDVKLFMRAIKQKLEGEDPAQETIRYFLLIPNL